MTNRAFGRIFLARRRLRRRKFNSQNPFQIGSRHGFIVPTPNGTANGEMCEHESKRAIMDAVPGTKICVVAKIEWCNRRFSSEEATV